MWVFLRVRTLQRVWQHHMTECCQLWELSCSKTDSLGQQIESMKNHLLGIMHLFFFSWKKGNRKATCVFSAYTRAGYQALNTLCSGCHGDESYTYEWREHWCSGQAVVMRCLGLSVWETEILTITWYSTLELVIMCVRGMHPAFFFNLLCQQPPPMLANRNP